MTDPTPTVPAGPQPLSDDELRALEAKVERAHAKLHALCDGTEKWRMSIPAKPDSDPDLVIAEGLEAADRLLADRQCLTTKLATAAAEADTWWRRSEQQVDEIADLRAELTEFTQHLAEDDLPDDVDTLRRYVQYARSTARYVELGNKQLRSRLTETRAERDQACAELEAARQRIADEIEQRAATLTPGKRKYRAFHAGLMEAAAIARGGQAPAPAQPMPETEEPLSDHPATRAKQLARQLATRSVTQPGEIVVRYPQRSPCRGCGRVDGTHRPKCILRPEEFPADAQADEHATPGVARDAGPDEGGEVSA